VSGLDQINGEGRRSVKHKRARKESTFRRTGNEKGKRKRRDNNRHRLDRTSNAGSAQAWCQHFNFALLHLPAGAHARLLAPGSMMNGEKKEKGWKEGGTFEIAMMSERKKEGS